MFDALPGFMTELKPIARAAWRPSPGTRFFFRACAIGVECGALIVTVPAIDLRWRGGLPTDAPWDVDWCEAEPFDYGEVRVPCEPGRALLIGVNPDPFELSGPTCRLVFTGGVRYGHVPGDPRFSAEVVGTPLAMDPDGRIWRPYKAVEFVQLHRHDFSQAAA